MLLRDLLDRPESATPEQKQVATSLGLLSSDSKLTPLAERVMLAHVINLDADGISPDWCATYPLTAAAIINDLARRLDGMTTNVEVTGLRGFSRRSG